MVWTPNSQLPGQKSKAPPALCTSGDLGRLLHMVHLGDSSNDIWHSWFDGNNWAPNVRIPGQKSKAAPACLNGSGMSTSHVNRCWLSLVSWADIFMSIALHFRL